MGPCMAMGAAAANALDLAGTGSVHQIDIQALAQARARQYRDQTHAMAEQGGLTATRDMKLTDDEKEMLDGVHGRAKARAMDLLVRYGEALGAERLVETNNVAGAFNASTPSVRELVEEGLRCGLFGIQSRQRGSGRGAEDGRPHLPADHRHRQRQLAHAGHSGRSRRAAEARRGILRQPRHQHVRDLHALSGRQCAGEGRALRLDGILRRRLLQLGARRAHQHRGQGEHRRRGAHRPHSLLGLSHQGEPARHPSRRGGHRRRRHHGLGPARLLPRRDRRRRDPGARPAATSSRA